MDDLGNIVYIVAAIGWVAWNTYNKSLKKKDEQPSSQPKQYVDTYEDKQPARSFEEIVRKQFEQNHQSRPVPVARVNKNQDKFLNTDLTHSHLSESYVMSSSEMKSNRAQRQTQKKRVMETEDENLMEHLMPNGFDLRQAVVLNSILERPYN